MATRVVVVDGSLRHVGQLTGEWERGPEGSRPARNAEECRRVALEGTDLGASFFDGTRIWFLFGDTWPNRTVSDGSLRDSAAWTTDLEPAGVPRLTFLGDGRWKSFELDGGAVGTREFEVPTGGFATDSGVYVFFATDHSDAEVMGRSVLGRAARVPLLDDFHDPTTLTHLYDVSIAADGGTFINVAPVVLRGGHPRLPFPGDALLLWGSGHYRRSDVHLAAVPLAAVEEPTAWWYWTGGPPDAPTWSMVQGEAAPVVRDGEVGELSVAWVAPLGRWLLTYNAEHPAGIVFHTAPAPWGPWTGGDLLYDPAGPLGHGVLLHTGWVDGALGGTDLLHDRGRGEDGGGPYGGYIVDRYTWAVAPDVAEVFFALSTWNPYQVALMAVQLRVVDDRQVLRDPGRGRLGRLLDVEGRIEGDGAAARLGAVVVHQRRGRQRIDPGTIPIAGVLDERPTGAPALVSSRFGAQGRNFELAVPRRLGGLLFRAADNDGDTPVWGAVASVLGGGPSPPAVALDALAMQLSPVPDFGPGADPAQRRHDRLVVVGVSGGRVVQLWRDRVSPWPWRGPFPVIAVEDDDRHVPVDGVRGNPALVQSTFGAQRMNFELVVPDAVAGVRHLWRDHDLGFPLTPDWRLAPSFAVGLGVVDAVTMALSAFADADDRRHLEVVIRRGGELHHCWRGGAGWSEPRLVVADGLPLAGARGVPSLVQGGHGAKGRNFELLTPLAAGGLGAYWLDNDPDDAGDRRWHGPAVVDPGGAYVAVAMLQGPFGPAPGNLEVAATTADGRVVHLWRDGATKAWSTPVPLVPA